MSYDDDLREQLRRQEEEAAEKAMRPKPDPFEHDARAELVKNGWKPETEEEREKRQEKNRQETPDPSWEKQIPAFHQSETVQFYHSWLQMKQKLRCPFCDWINPKTEDISSIPQPTRQETNHTFFHGMPGAVQMGRVIRHCEEMSLKGKTNEEIRKFLIREGFTGSYRRIMGLLEELLS